MKHDWVRVLNVARQHVIHECRKCGMRRRLRHMGPRGGGRWTFKWPGEKVYYLQNLVPRCGGTRWNKAVKGPQFREITAALQKEFSPEVIREAVEQGRAIIWNGKRVNL